MSQNSASKLKPIWHGILRTIMVVVTTLVLVIVTLILLMLEIAHGPSDYAKRFFVCSVKETSAIGFLADWFYSDEEITKFIGLGRTNATNETTDPTLVHVSTNPTDPTDEDPAEPAEKNDLLPDEPLSIIEIKGSTYKGKLMAIRDPNRVFVGVCGEFSEDKPGKTVLNMMSKYDAIAGTNGGGFKDTNGVGNGGMPIGIVISQGKLCHGSKSATYQIIGFDNNNILHVGNMTGQQALDAGIRDAVSFGPMLIVNGKAMNEEAELSGGFNPRTAIGQTADGTVLLLVLEGRQASSIGATYDDLVSIFQKYGAVNAANLDGGSSSELNYNGELITICSSLYGPRKMPSCILIKKEGNE